MRSSRLSGLTSASKNARNAPVPPAMAKACRFVLFAVILASTAPISTLGFNLEVEDVVVHRGPRDSMFGFSVAMHIARNQGWLLVGAPEAQTRQPGVVRGGTVFRCSPTESDRCQPVPFDSTGNNKNQEGQQIDDKSGQWLGATVRSAGVDGPVLACAPRYVYFSVKLQRREPVGTCFLQSPTFQDVRELSPCRTWNWGYHRQGSCQAGLGADISSDHQRVFIGAVGSWYWQGQLFQYDAAGRGNVTQTSEGPPMDDDSYLGYSVATGEFTGDGQMDVVVGMPRGDKLRGKIVFFSSEMENTHNISGVQLGAYFGYSLAVCDVNGDGLDDVLVGAPMYTDEKNRMNWEVGRVYVAYQNRVHKFKQFATLDGFRTRGRFGMSIASLGDLDKDGYGDFAVGAPYDGEDGRGVVYIYLGSIDGVVKTPSQTIAANTISPGMETFGFSLSGGLDLDFNQYPDLLIGSYKSDSVAYLRARPVVNVSGGFYFESQEKPSKGIDLSNKQCQLLDGTQVPCLMYRLCLHYGGEGVNPQIALEVEYTLDSKKNAPRMYFLKYEGRNKFRRPFHLTKGQMDCDTGHVYIKEGIRDKLTPIVGTASFKLSEGTAAVRGLQPVVGPVHSFEDAITIQRNCGGDDVCIPDLKLSAVLNRQSYLVGSGDNIEMNVKVFNDGEDSFETTAFLTMPEGVNYVKVERLDTNRGIPVFCSPNQRQRIVKCDIGNPLPGFQEVRFNIILHPQTFPGDRENLLRALDFTLTVNSTNPDDESSSADNIRKISLPLRVEAELLVSGIQEPETVTYNRSNYKKSGWESEKDVGPQVVHRYIVENRGPSDINEAEAFIVWPTYASSGDYLLYLMEQPEIEGPGRCRRVKNVNPLNLVIAKERIQGSAEYLEAEYESTSGGTGAGSGEGNEGLMSSTTGEHVQGGYVAGGSDGYAAAAGGSASSGYHHESASSGVVGVSEGDSRLSGGVDGNVERKTSRTWSTSGVSDGGERVKTTYYEEKSYKSSSGSSSSSRKSYSGGKTKEHFGTHEDDFYGSDWDPNGNDLPRSKRQTAQPAWMKDFRREANDCGLRTNCTIIKCTIGPLGQADKFIVTLRSRLWINTLADLGYDDVSISSTMVARVTSLPHGVDPSYMRYQTHAVKSIINPGDELFEAKPVPWWIYLLAALGGLLLLLVVIYGLYKCGFFKRKRPKHSNGSGPGRVPLNGYDPSDTPL